MTSTCTPAVLRAIISPYLCLGIPARNPFGQQAWAGQVAMDPSTDRLTHILAEMARGSDVWDEFVDLLGPFILHVLKDDYGFYQEYDSHARQEILHDIYLRVVTYADRYKGPTGSSAYYGYLRKIIRTVIVNRLRIMRRWQREISLEAVTDGHHSANPGYLQSTREPGPLDWLEALWKSRQVSPVVRTAIKSVATQARDHRKTRLILEQRLLYEKPYGEIARLVGMEVDAVRQTVHYYREKVILEARNTLGLVPGEGESNA